MSKLAAMLIAVIVTASAAMPARAGESGPPLNKPLPAFELPSPRDAAQRRYLDLGQGRKTFSIGELRTGVVIIEVFNFYCPFCRREATRVNALYNLIQSDPQLDRDIKVIGIGAGNSVVEVNDFRKTFDVAFPLFPDNNFKIHKLLGKVRTPFFIAVRIVPGGRPVVFYTRLGGFSSPRGFLEQIVEKGGLAERR